jgi:hypothetical protein
VKALLRWLGFAGIAVGVLAYPLAFGADAALGQDLLIVEAAGDPAAVDANRGLWELDGSPKDGVAKIYGTPRPPAARLLLVPADKILHPKEDPSLAIYLKQSGDHPTQAQTLVFFALPATIGGLVAGGALLFLASRKKAPAAPG